MRALIFGSTGMVGSEALKEAIKNPEITEITIVNRRKANTDQGVKEIIHANFLDYSSIKDQISGYDIVIYCLAVYGNAKGMTEEKYYEITHDYVIELVKVIENPKTVFIFFSAAGANSKSNLHWAKTKGITENDLLEFKFKSFYALRPGGIRASDRSKFANTGMKIADVILWPVINVLFPKFAITSNQIGQSMVKIALRGYEKQILENVDIRRSIGLKRGV